MKFRIIAAACAAFSIAAPAYAGAAQKFAAEIPNIPGKSLIANEVTYAPGEASPAHTHGPVAFIYAYVISGAIESKVNDGETRIYQAGESFPDPRGAMHWVCRNASKTEPAKFLA